ncbi:MAG: secretin N-terminal domain-containing protein [Nitrososphaerales archaeon]
MYRAEYWFKTVLHAMNGVSSKAICNAGVLLCIGSIFLILSRPGVVSVHAQPLVSLNLRDADVVKTLRTLAELGSLNVVISPDVHGTVTLRLKDVPVEDALEILLKTMGLAQVRKGSVIGILPRQALLEHQKQLAELRALRQEEFRTQVVRLNYARATELAHILAPLLSPWGTITPDERTNSLIIRDVVNSPIFQHTQSAPMVNSP